MSGDAQCLGICMFDWDAGICLGCGRTAEDIEQAGAAEASPAAESAPAAPGADAPPPDADTGAGI